MASVGRKSSMMERLRQLRLGPSENTTSQPQVPANNAPEANKTLKSALKSKSKSRFNKEDHAEGRADGRTKGRARDRAESLDLQHVNSKLQAIALERIQSQEDDEAAELEEGQFEEVIKFTAKHDDGPAITGVDGATENTTGNTTGTRNILTKASDNDHAASERSKSTGPSIVLSPPDDDLAEGSTEPTDFQLFLQKAELNEHKRKERGQTAIPKSKPEPALNQFYSNNLASSSSVPNHSKLAEIQEATEGDDNGPAGEGKQHAVESAAASSNNDTSDTASSGSNDFAATERRPARATTNTTLGRHVSFSEPDKIRRAVTNNSARYNPRGCESPSPEGARRRSIRAFFRSCLRWT